MSFGATTCKCSYSYPNAVTHLPEDLCSRAFSVSGFVVSQTIRSRDAMRRLWVSRMDKLGNSTERCWGSARSALFQVAQVRFRDSLTHLPGVLGHYLGHSLGHKEIQTLKWLTWSPTNRYGSSSLLYCSECMAKLYPVADTRVHHRQEAVLNLTGSDCLEGNPVRSNPRWRRPARSDHRHRRSRSLVLGIAAADGGFPPSGARGTPVYIR